MILLPNPGRACRLLLWLLLVVLPCALQCAPAGAAAEPPAVLDAEDAATPRPLAASSELVVTAEVPRSLVWDAERHAGALAVRGAVLVLAELREPGGRPASALKLVADVPLDGVEHLALGRDDGSVYASSSRKGTLHALALEDGSQRFTIPAGGPEPAVLFHHPAQARLASFNAGVNTVTVFDVRSHAFEGLIPLGDTPVAVRMAPDGQVLALLPERRELTLLSLHPLRIGARWALPEDCTHPQDFDVDPVGQRILLACGTHEVAVFDYREAEWRSNLLASTGTGTVDRVLWDGRLARLLAVCSDGTVNQAGPDADHVHALASLNPGSAVDLDAAGNRLVWASPDEKLGIRIGFAPLQ